MVKMCPRRVHGMSQAHEVVGLAVYQRAGDAHITLGLVRQVMAELADHLPGAAAGVGGWMTRQSPALRIYAVAFNVL